MALTFAPNRPKFVRPPPGGAPPEREAGPGAAAVLAVVHDLDAVRQRSPREVVASQFFAGLDLALTEEDRTFWCYLKAARRASFTPELLADLARMQQMICGLFAATARGDEAPFDYFVYGSRSPGVFNLGGDLLLFADLIRRGEREQLRRYAYECVNIVHAAHTGYGQNIVTIALVQGDALGGGFESALSCDLLIAERAAKFGLPEIVFNLFPGMGAYSLLSRRVGSQKAEQIILSGRLYTAEEMHALGVVDMLVDDGDGDRAVREYCARNRSRHLAHSMIYQVRRRVNPISLDELRDVADLWLDVAMRLSAQSLSKMCRIAAAQERLGARQADQKLASA